MANYNIGSFSAPSLSGKREDDVVYFADMPVEGEPMCERGPEGLGIINSAILSQLRKKDQQEKLAIYQERLKQLTEVAQDFERVLIEIANDELRAATINNVIFRTERAYLQDQEAIANFLYANDRMARRRADLAEAVHVGPKQ